MRERLAVLGTQKIGGHAGVDMVPRQPALLAQVAEIAFRIEARGCMLLGNSALPQIFAQDLVQPSKRQPSRKARSSKSAQARSPRAKMASKSDWVLSCIFTVTPRRRPRSSSSACLCAVSSRLSMAAHCRGVCGLGTKMDTAAVTWPTQIASADLLHARRGLDNAQHVFVGLAGQPDHEVQLHALLATRKHAVGRFQDVGSDTFLLTTSRMRWVPASGEKVRPGIPRLAISPKRSSCSP